MEKLHPVGVVCGRFQPLHNGHLNEYLLPAKEKCDLLIVGITNPDLDMTQFDPACPHRAYPETNPYSYYERLKMVKNSLLEAGVPENEFEIVPLPINFPEKILNYITKNVQILLSIGGPWGYKKKDIFEGLGFSVEVIDIYEEEDREISGKIIREMIKNNDNRWNDMVPEAVKNIILENKKEE